MRGCDRCLPTNSHLRCAQKLRRRRWVANCEMEFARTSRRSKSTPFGMPRGEMRAECNTLRWWFRFALLNRNHLLRNALTNYFSAINSCNTYGISDIGINMFLCIHCSSISGLGSRIQKRQCCKWIEYVMRKLWLAYVIMTGQLMEQSTILSTFQFIGYTFWQHPLHCLISFHILYTESAGYLNYEMQNIPTRRLQYATKSHFPYIYKLTACSFIQ